MLDKPILLIKILHFNLKRNSHTIPHTNTPTDICESLLNLKLKLEVLLITPEPLHSSNP